MVSYGWCINHIIHLFVTDWVAYIFDLVVVGKAIKHVALVFNCKVVDRCSRRKVAKSFPSLAKILYSIMFIERLHLLFGLALWRESADFTRAY